MANLNDFPAVGRIISADVGSLIFAPHNSSYELKLETSSKYEGALNQLVRGLIRVAARKVYTVPSGGNFISPIFGPPRIVQGRIRYVDEANMVVQAGAPIVVQLPADESALDLVNGALAVGAIANVVALPDAKFELLEKALTV